MARPFARASSRFITGPASTNTRDTFSSSYGFPIDNLAWLEILACAEARIAARPYPHTLGDLSCDGSVNAFDIDPFVLALTDPDGYAAAWPDCDIMNADCNADGVVNAFDIDPFVELLIGP